MEIHMRMRRTLLLLASAIVLMLSSLGTGWADSRIEKSLDLQPGGRFLLKTDNGSVTVTGENSPGARIVITSRRDDLNDLMIFDFQARPGEVEVTGRRRGDFSWHHGFSVHFEIQVPKETALNVHTAGGGIEVYSIQKPADLDTSGGGIKVEGFKSELHAHTSGGGITLREVDGNSRVDTSGGGIEAESIDGPLDAHTSGGSIRIDRITGDLVAETSGGGIQIEGAGGRVHANTSGGSVSVSFERGNSRGGEVGTSGGSVHVALDPGANLDIEASTSAGHVNSSLPIKVSHVSGSSLVGTLGSGGSLLKLHSSAGSVELVSR
jgi:DUF4097 and DUF4098 domain-containing protein YvlB